MPTDRAPEETSLGPELKIVGEAEAKVESLPKYAHALLVVVDNDGKIHVHPVPQLVEEGYDPPLEKSYLILRDAVDGLNRLLTIRQFKKELAGGL